MQITPKAAWDYYSIAAPYVHDRRVWGRAHVAADVWRALERMRNAADPRLGGRLLELHPVLTRRLGRDVPMEELRFARTCIV
eukprot:7227812-Prymnesium_polylepis.2